MQDEKDTPDEDVIVGGGPAEGEDHTVQMPNPDAVHPDFSQTIPGEASQASTTESGTSIEEGSDDADQN